MQTAESYVIFGPLDALDKMIPSLTEETSPKFYYKHDTGDERNTVVVCVYEKQKKVTNETDALTTIIEYSGKSVKVQLMPLGGRTGFRGGASDGEPPVYDEVKDFILDFTKRFGLTIQENKEEEETEEKK